LFRVKELPNEDVEDIVVEPEKNENLLLTLCLLLAVLCLLSLREYTMVYRHAVSR
jgi:hypothetical protein